MPYEDVFQLIGAIQEQATQQLEAPQAAEQQVAEE
jgi:hypothetical protein